MSRKDRESNNDFEGVANNPATIYVWVCYFHTVLYEQHPDRTLHRALTSLGKGGTHRPAPVGHVPVSHLVHAACITALCPGDIGVKWRSTNTDVYIGIGARLDGEVRR